MTWDELFEDRLADAGHLVCAIDEAGDHVTLAEAPVGEVVRVVREALLSDDAVERAARALCAAAGENPDSNELWDEEPPWLSYADEARAALTAAIGDDDE